LKPFKKIHYLSIIGILISIILLSLVLIQLDWQNFIVTLKSVQIQWVIASGLFMIFGIAIRSLRWNVISGHPRREYRYFWKSMNLGYFANMIYPARAGEVVRMIAIHRYVGMPQGKAISGVIIDRISDGLTLGLFILLLLALKDTRFTWGIAFIFFILIFIALSLLLLSFILWGDRLHGKIFRFMKIGPKKIANQLEIWYTEAFDGVQIMRDKYRFFIILALSIGAFLADAICFYLLTLGFGWELPFIVSIYLAIFIQAGTVIPSAPGYVGIYQIACVLALRIFGIDDSAAIAYSLVLQVLGFGIFLFFGGVIVIRDGFSPYMLNKDSTLNSNR